MTIDGFFSPATLDQRTENDIFQNWADSQLDAPAIVSNGQMPPTYLGLTQQFNHVGAVLAEAGFGSRSRIGIFHSGGPEMVTILLGVGDAAVDASFIPAPTAEEFWAHIQKRQVSGVIVPASVVWRPVMSRRSVSQFWR